MTRRSLAVVLAAFIVALAGALVYRSWTAASGAAGGKSDPSAKVSERATAPATGDSAATTARARELVPLTVYFPSRRYVESGDESLPRVVAERVEVEVTDAGADVETLARTALAALAAGPKTAAATLAIPKRLAIRRVHVRDGVAYVDFARDGLSGGSLEETLLVRSIVRTLTGVPRVRAVQFLIEGQAPETLMGHVTTTEPISLVD